MAARLAAAPAALRVRRPAASLPAPRRGQARGCRGGPPCASSAASSPPRQRRRRAEGRAGGWRCARPLCRVRGPARPPPLPLPAAPQRRVGARRRRHARGPLCTYATSSPPAPPAPQAGGAAPPAGGAGPGRAGRAALRRAEGWRGLPRCEAPGGAWLGTSGRAPAPGVGSVWYRRAEGQRVMKVGPWVRRQRTSRGSGFVTVGPKVTRRSMRRRRPPRKLRVASIRRNPALTYAGVRRFK